MVEPTDAKKAVGWATNEQPPSSYFNWMTQIEDAWIHQHHRTYLCSECGARCVRDEAGRIVKYERWPADDESSPPSATQRPTGAF